MGLVVLPLLAGSGLLVIPLLKAKPDVADRRVAVVDRTGVAAAAVIQAATEKNAKELFDKTSGRQIAPRYLFETVPADENDLNGQRLALSDRVRSRRLYAFLEIGPQALQPDENAKDKAAGRVACYSNASAIDDTRRWFDGPISTGIQQMRLAQLGVDHKEFRNVLSSVVVERLSLVSRDEKTGAIRKAEKKNDLESLAAPLGLILLLAIVVGIGSGPILSAVTEDRSQRIVEMLLSLATPFELMMGKVAAAVGIALTSSLFYVAGGTLALLGLGMIGMVPFALLPWFYVYLVADVVMFCALAAAVAAGCNSPQEAQGLTMLLLGPTMGPFLLLMPVIQRPNSALATVASMFPLFTPKLMLLRQAMPGGIPAWQPWVALIGMAAWTVFAVWAAGRIFRVGILMQGKPPKIADLVRWAIRG